MNNLDAQLISVLHQLPPDLKTVLAAFARRELEKQSDANATPDGKEPADESR